MSAEHEVKNLKEFKVDYLQATATVVAKNKVKHNKTATNITKLK